LPADIAGRRFMTGMNAFPTWSIWRAVRAVLVNLEQPSCWNTDSSTLDRANWLWADGLLCAAEFRPTGGNRRCRGRGLRRFAKTPASKGMIGLRTGNTESEIPQGIQSPAPDGKVLFGPEFKGGREISRRGAIGIPSVGVFTFENRPLQRNSFARSTATSRGGYTLHPQGAQ